MNHGILNLEWLNSNAVRRYPLAEDAPGRDTTGSFTLPTDFLVAMDLPVSAGMDVDPTRFFVCTVSVFATGFAVIVGYQPASGPAVNVASAVLPRAGFVPNTTYALGGIGDYADTVGKLTVGRLGGIDRQPSGSFTFTLEQARIEPDCVRPMLRGVTSITLVNGSDRSEPLYGDIELVAQENIQLVPVLVDGQDPQIRISAIQGEGLADPCVCEGDDISPPIKRINGIPPTPAGNFNILGSDCLRVDAIDNGLQLTDVCSEPCCGCKELEAVTRDLEQFGGKAATLENFVARLEASVTQMDQVVLGSRLGDRGCSTCEG